MTANNGYPLSAPWEGFGSSPELDGPITRDGNEKNPPPALLDDRMFFLVTHAVHKMVLNGLY